MIRKTLAILIFIGFASMGISQLNPGPPAQSVRLVFIHHSVGEDWLREGGLLQALNDNNYYVTDTNYDWGPVDQDVNDGNPIGYHTDIGHWYNWFLGLNRDTYLQALYTNNHLTQGLQNSIPDPGGENTIVMFKSCFSSGQVIYGDPNDPPLSQGVNNPLWGVGVCDDPQCSGSANYTVSNIKGLYRDLLDYFATRQDKLFILITTPPSLESAIGDPALAAKLRAINNWLVHEWLANYPYNNVFVFDYYNVLTSNGGDPNTNDVGAATGNHHRYNPTTGQIEHVINLNNDFLAYGSDTDNDGAPDDNHPTAAGHQKATAEFIPLLNIAYNRWRSSAPIGQISVTPQTVDFGNVDVGDVSAPQTITVTNQGNSAVTLGSIVLTGPDAGEFSIQNDQCSNATLQPSDSRTITVVFSPTSPGQKTAGLEHQGSSYFAVTLTGTGAGGSTSGNVYYVSPNGDNSNPGTRDLPWATPGYGSRQLHPGDTLIILGGRYVLSQYDADIITPPSGTADAWIIIKGEEGNRPVLAGRNNLSPAIDLSGCSYVRIENLEITSDDQASGQARYFRDGIEILGQPASHIVLKDLYIHHLDEYGMNLQDVEDLQILDCRIEYCGFGAIGGPEGTAGGWRNVLIRGCYLSYSGHYYQGVPDNPSNPYDRPDGFGIEPSDGPVEIADTVAEHNKGDGLDSKARNTYIHNCVVANNSCDGIKLWGDGSRIENCLIYGTGDGVGGSSPWAGIVIDQVDQPNAYFEIVNTTLHDNPTREAYPMYVQYPPSNTPITLVMRNTIVAGGHGEVFIGDPVTFTAEHCLFYRPGGDPQVHANGRDYTAGQIEAGELGEGNLSRDPLFVSPAWGTEGDYHLQQGSPAIDAGMSGPGIPPVDLEYIPRPLGAAPDIGAYEFRSGRISDLEITKADSPDPVMIGGQVTYTLTVTNRGPDPVEYAYVSDNLHHAVTFVSASPSVGNASYDRQSHSVVWHIPELGVNEQATLNITIQTPYDTAYNPIVNTATVVGATTSPDPNPENNTAVQETHLITPTEQDGDGISDAEEQGPQGNDPSYDGNNDGTPDWQQDNVASTHTFDGSYYVTLASSGGSLRDVRTMTNPHPQDAPQDADFPWGFFSFRIELDPGAAEATVTLYLPQGSDPSTYYKYGPTSDNPTDHWYEFTYDGQTGAEINGNVITLHFIDGGRGDDDLAQNGVIIDQNAPASRPVSIARIRNTRTQETFTSISEAVSQAQPGDTLLAEGQGTFVDNVRIDKALTLTVVSGADITVQAGSPSSPVFTILVDGVTIEGFKITGATQEQVGAPAGGVYLYDASNCTIRDNRILGNIYGIWLDQSSGCEIAGNLIESSSQIGLYISRGGSHTVRRNILRSNHMGLRVELSNDNAIFLNDFIDNTTHTSGSNANNSWYSPQEMPYHIVNGPQTTGHLGNYWDDYTGQDNNRDGIGESPYLIPFDNDDLYPLVRPSANYITDPDRLPVSIVNIMTGATYYSLQRAVEEAMPGTVLSVRGGGSLLENVIIGEDKLGLTISAEEGSNVYVTAKVAAAPVITIRADEVTITGLGINGADVDVPTAIVAGIYLLNVSGCNIWNNLIHHNVYGIYMQGAARCHISGNRIESNDRAGIRMVDSSVTEPDRNQIIRNIIDDSDYGISILNSGGNLIYLNDFRGNHNAQVSTDGSVNEWSSPDELLYLYGETVARSRLGNHWGNWYGNDTNMDGIGDTPYQIDENNLDRFPLMGDPSDYLLEQVPQRVHNLSTGLDYHFLSEAVNDPRTRDGDEIVVDPGRYLDNVAVTKSLTISGSGGAQNTIIWADNPDAPVISVQTEGVTISGFTLSGSTGVTSGAGLRLVRCRNCTVSNNRLTANEYGLWMELSDENVISNNLIRDNAEGVHLYSSHHNLISGNTVSGNTDGLFLRGGGGNRISHNRIEDNDVGLDLSLCSDNLIFLNAVRQNGTGVSTGSSGTGNIVFLNDFTGNDHNVLSDPGGSAGTRWYTLVEVSYRYGGGQFTGYLGNYWDDYLVHYPATPPEELDADHNGVWDRPYPVDNDEDDPYPLAEPTENYEFDEGSLVPLIAVYPNKIDFNAVLVGTSSRPIPVTITNLSGVRVDINSIELSGGEASQFRVEDTITWLGPHTWYTVKLYFEPSSAGLKKTTLRISTEGFNGGFEIPVEGIGAVIGLPRTGQVECYAPDGTWIYRFDRWSEGQDGRVRAGVPWPLDATERFIDNGDGTVTDRLTGLMWLKSANPIKRFHPEFDAPPEDGDPHENGDRGDGLVSWRYADMFIQKMNDGTYSDCNAGYTDWRLPNINELESLLNYGEQSYLWLGSRRTQGGRVFDDTAFYNYWASTKKAVVNMSSGESTPTFNFVACVWPVRGPVQLPNNESPIIQLPKTTSTTFAIYEQGVQWPFPRFEVYQDVIVDKLTGLMWTRSADLDTEFANRRVSWGEALDLVSNLRVGGYTDWRLPNVRELRSLIDYWEDHPDDYLLGQGFENVSNTYSYWTSTTEPAGSHNRAFIVALADGHISLVGKSGQMKVIAVRGGVLLPDEEWGPEGDQQSYDGNNDGIPDAEQPNVSSLHTFNGEGYVTIVSPGGTVIEESRPVNPADIPEDPPSGVDLPWGLFTFTIENVPPGGSVTVTIHYTGSDPNAYWKYGPTPNNPDPHWYEFTYDGRTGAEINAGENRITLHFVDGGRGDDDLTPNGRIVDVNGPAISTAPNIAASPSILNFGTLSPGNTKELSLTISNEGSGDLNVGQISITGPNASEFQITQDDCSNQTIPPGGSRQVKVEFRPQSPGMKEAKLQIPSDDPDTSLLSVDLRGGGGLLLGDVSGNGKVTAYDAAEILRYLVGKEELSEDQLKAADVSGNGEVSAFDAAIILRFVVGLIEEFTHEEGAPSLKVGSRTLSLPSLKAKPGERITVPILVDDPSGIISGQIKLRFDGKALRFIKAESDFELESNVEGNTLKLAFAGVEARNARELIRLEFEVKDSTSEHAYLKFERGRLNESDNVKLVGGVVELIPTRTELLQNYPNPFNPETWIPFRLAEDGEVVIRIYDVMGRLVRRLDLGEIDAGSYTSRDRAAYWDGRNDLGEKVASGVYIYQMQIGGKTFARRMVMLK